MKGTVMPYVAVLVVLVLMAVAYLWQKSVILKQGYEIAKLRAAVESLQSANEQYRTEISAELSPARILAVLGDDASNFVKAPVEPSSQEYKPARLARK